MKKGDIFSRYWCKSLIRSKGQVDLMQDILKQHLFMQDVKIMQYRIFRTFIGK